MKEMTFEEKRFCKLKGILQTMKDFRMLSTNINFQKIINLFFENGKFHTNDFNKLVKYVYGYSDNEFDVEYILCEILTLYRFISIISPNKSRGGYKEDILKKERILENAREIIKTFLPEYKIESFTTNGDFLKYKPSEHQPVIDNLKNIREDIANPIVELLAPMKNENELIGLISKVHMQFEDIESKDLTYLNEIDKNIYKTIKKLVCKVDR